MSAETIAGDEGKSMTTTIHEAARALLPCPFCAGDATLTDLENGCYRYVMCSKCGACCNNADTMPETDCVDAWNRRAALAANDERVSVPREPTDAMICAGWDVEELQTPKRVWAAMLAAAEKGKG